MYPFKRKTASDASSSPELTEEEKQRRKKFVIYPLMFLLFAGCMWLIFAPSKKEEEQDSQGFNTEMPDPQASELIGDKKKAYEKEMMEQKEQERSRAMQSLSSMFGEMTGGQPVQSSEELALKTDLSERDNGFGSRTTAPQEGFHASASAYQDINRTLGSFYEAPREDPEKEEMRTRLKELESRMSAEQQSPAITVNDQMALLEKSYQLAAKYMPAGGNGQSVPNRCRDSLTDGEKHHICLCVQQSDGYGRADGAFPSLGTDVGIGQGGSTQCPCRRNGKVAGRTARRCHFLIGVSGKHHSRRAVGL